jgi:hypothetical protein
MVKNTEKICYDAEYDDWFSDHPHASDYIFAPIQWVKQNIMKHLMKSTS